jgi:hypothetical protein
LLEALSLTLWAGVAAWYAGLRGRPLALSLLGGLVVSAIVLLLQVVLQPGRVADDGELAPVQPSGAVALPIREMRRAMPQGDGVSARPFPVPERESLRQ